MKNYRVYIIRKVFYPYAYETYYFIGNMADAQKWCDKNRDHPREIYCNIEGSKTMTAYRIEELKRIIENVIDNRSVKS